jgi:hypothetical protein
MCYSIVVREGGIDFIRAQLTARLGRNPWRPCGTKDFSDLLLTPGVGARTVRPLVIMADVVHGISPGE